jgi:hypothetical protein
MYLFLCMVTQLLIISMGGKVAKELGALGVGLVGQKQDEKNKNKNKQHAAAKATAVASGFKQAKILNAATDGEVPDGVSYSVNPAFFARETLEVGDQHEGRENSESSCSDDDHELAYDEEATATPLQDLNQHDSSSGDGVDVTALAQQLDVGSVELRKQLPPMTTRKQKRVKKTPPAGSGWTKSTGNHGFYKRRQHAFSRVGWLTVPAVNRFQPLLARAYSKAQMHASASSKRQARRRPEGTIGLSMCAKAALAEVSRLKV